MRLLLFLHDLAPFGAQRVGLHVARSLDREKFDVTVCSFRGDDTLAPEFAACGASVVALKARRFLDPAAWLRLARLLLRLRPCVVQTTLPELSVPARVLALFMPGSAVVHGVHNPLSSEPWYWRSLNRLTFPLCSSVIFCSQGVMADAGVSGKRYSAIRNGVEPAGSGPGDPPIPESGEETVCCVGRLTRQKGQDLLIRAAAIMARRGRSLRVLLAGDGEEAEALRRLAAEEGIPGQVQFLGRRLDVRAVLAAADLYAAPSRWEGFDIALGEAMLAGLPCAGTAIPGHADLLRDGETGVAVPPENPAALADGLARLLDDRALAARLSAAGKKMISESFSVTAMAEKYGKAYLEAAGRAA